MVELVDTPDSKSGFERSDGSSPSSGTKHIDKALTYVRALLFLKTSKNIKDLDTYVSLTLGGSPRQLGGFMKKYTLEKNLKNYFKRNLNYGAE